MVRCRECTAMIENRTLSIKFALSDIAVQRTGIRTSVR